MKPLFSKGCIALLLSCIFTSIILFSCSKHDESNNNEFILKQRQEVEMLAQIGSLTYKEAVPGSSKENYLNNKNNPYEIAGNTTEKVLFKVLNDIRIKKANPDSLKAIIISELNRELPETFLHPDTTDYIKFEETLKTSMINILSEGYNDYISKSMQIENIIISSDCLSDLQKKRVLVFSSVLRHNMGVAHQILSSSKGTVEVSPLEEFAKCLIEKNANLTNCTNCTIERFLCKVEFVQCVAVWAADCLLSMVS
jgi:hypothetical protein